MKNLRLNIRRTYWPWTKATLDQTYRELLITVLTKAWPAAIPVVLASATAALRYLDSFFSPVQAYLQIALCLAIALVIYLLHHYYQVEPTCHTCDQDKTRCWGNFARHHDHGEDEGKPDFVQDNDLANQ